MARTSLSHCCGGLNKLAQEGNAKPVVFFLEKNELTNCANIVRNNSIQAERECYEFITVECEG